MTIGVFFIGNLNSGGLYQYSLSILDGLQNRRGKLVIFNLSGADFPHQKYSGYFEVSNSFKHMGLVKQLGVNIYRRFRLSNAMDTTGNVHEKTVVSKKSAVRKVISGVANWADILFLRIPVKLNRIDLLIFTAPSHLSFKLKMPYIMPIHSLQHRLTPQFPEVSAHREWEAREYLYSNAIPNAEAILVDSEVGKEDVLSFYPIDRERVKVLPHILPNYLRGDYSVEELRRIRAKYNLPERFLFYPANFWPHKNHKLIIQALNHIKVNPGLKIPAVFVGSKQEQWGEFDRVCELVNAYGLEAQVYYLGYVPNEDMGCLYKFAEALVMPTFFGPEPIPYLEAFSLGCPVIGSDIRGIREQIGNAGLLVDPNSSEDLAAAILRIWDDAELRHTLRKMGYDRMKSWDFERFSGRLNKIVDEVLSSL